MMAWLRQHPLAAILGLLLFALALYFSRELFHFIFHINEYLQRWSQEHPAWIYGAVLLIVFCETGLVFMPFLPGDSLLFALGSLAALGHLSLPLLMLLLLVAAILGDALNFQMGKRFGHAILRRGWLKPEHWQATHDFYARHGEQTIVLARFVPIIRTVAPFAAGLSRMAYPRFMRYNLLGALLWIVGLLSAGYLFGSLPWVQRHFSLLVLAIVLISLLPALVPAWRAWRKKAS